MDCFRTYGSPVYKYWHRAWRNRRITSGSNRIFRRFYFMVLGSLFIRLNSLCSSSDSYSLKNS